MSEYIDTIGYGGPAPLAIVFWYAAGESEPANRTICFDEDELIAVYKRHTTPGDIYSTMRPSVVKVGEQSCETSKAS